MTSQIDNLTIKWSGKEFKVINLTPANTVLDLKNEIKTQTGVLPEHQKLLGLKCAGKQVENDTQLSQLKLKPNVKIMMMGSKAEDLVEVQKPPENMPEVVNDFDIEEEEIAVENREEYLAKVERRIKDYKVNILNAPRPEKKLLVLDIDYTLFDHRSTAETANELMRPYLHEFLTSAYEDYDIVIWSATSMKWIEVKMKELGVSSNENYKICFYMDSLAMITVEATKYGVIEVKPLGVIWGKFTQWSKQNTIMFDDLRRNFSMNPQSGLKIRPFRQAHFNRSKDVELLKLSKYLKDISTIEDFSDLNHKKWERYCPNKKRRTDEPQ